MSQDSVTNPIDSDSVKVINGVQRIPEFMQFVKWFATPRQFRTPKTQKQFAKKIGVCEDSLTDWKKHEKFWPLAQKEMSVWIKDRIPDAIGGLYKNAAKKGSPKAVEIFLQLGGILNKSK